MSKISNLRIAIIAEDDTDCDAIRTIVHRVLNEKISTEKWASKGCGILRRKLPAKIKAFSQKGCNAFVIIHDLDRNPQNGSLNDESKLRKDLEKSISSFQGINKHICIPIEELEAWFWSDPVLYLCKRNGRNISATLSGRNISATISRYWC